jgi:hypothetical protein
VQFGQVVIVSQPSIIQPFLRLRVYPNNDSVQIQVN